MKPEEQYHMCTEEGCRKTLTTIHALDDNVTIGELRSYLNKRMGAAKKEAKIRSEKMNELAGKCFKIVFSKEHTEYLKIDKIFMVDKYGTSEAAISGEAIINFKNNIHYDIISYDENNSDKTKWFYSYQPNESCETITVEDFNKVKELYDSLNKNF